MRIKQKAIWLFIILLAVLILMVGCKLTTPTTSSIIIANGEIATNLKTPELTIFAEGAADMAFSGDGIDWGEWIDYAETYEEFDITEGPGCTEEEGEKVVYVKFKDLEGNEFGQCYDTIKYDITIPKLTSALFQDIKTIRSIGKGDTIKFCFSEEMKVTSINSSNLEERLILTNEGQYGEGATVDWFNEGRICLVTLGQEPHITDGMQVHPSLEVTDLAGNQADSTNIPIDGLTVSGSLTAVSITPSNISIPAGGNTVQFVATAINEKAEDITPFCEIIWEISPQKGMGILTDTGKYTSPAANTGVVTIKVTAKYAGETKEAEAQITVSETQEGVVDPDRLMVSLAHNSDGLPMARYSSVPPGGSVIVYSDHNHGEGMEKRVTLYNNLWKNSPDIREGDHIFFEVIYPDGSSSGLIADGEIPYKPNASALKKIEVRNEKLAYALPNPDEGGNVLTNDLISLYIDGLAYSAPTPISDIGTPISLFGSLKAGDKPQYSKTDPISGHESGYTNSGDDGQVVQIATKVVEDVEIADITYRNQVDNDSTDGLVEEGDTITIKYSDEVEVTPALIEFKLGGVDIKANLTGAGSANQAILTIVDGPYDLSGKDSVNFNFSNRNIVDATGGGNWAIAHPVGIEWIPGDDF